MAAKKYVRKKRVKRVKKIKSPAEVVKAEKARETRLKKIFNITSMEFEKVLEFQNGICPITQRVSKLFVVDHDHSSGRVRGILDWKINRAIGHFYDDPDLLERAADYLRHPTVPQALGEEVFGVMGRVTNKVRKYGPLGTKEPQKRKKS